MQEFLNNIIPNVMAKLPDFYAAIGDTLLMVVWSGAISFVLGLALGVLLTVTKPGGILENKVVYQIVDKLVSLFRSIPFIILLTWVMPFSRVVMGTALYVRGAIVPLVFGAVPFFARQVQSALAELDGGLIEAALSMGSSPLEIIFRVYLKESVAAIARGTTITAISLLNLTAMAGVVGAGGLGDFAGQMCETLNKTTGLTVAVTDRDSVVAAAGSARRDLIGKRISTELEQIMEDRAIYRAQGSERSVYVTDTLDRCCAAIAAPIISEGDALGLVLFVENEGENHVGETEYKLAQTIASFLGRHMES